MTNPSRDLAALCSTLTGVKPRGRLRGILVRGVSADSREIKPGDVFVCLKGARHDGHAFVPKAVRDGAVAVVAERPLRLTTPVLVVSDARRAMAEMSAALWDYPSRHLDVFGITGTNGKTTTGYMLESILRAAGVRPALFGTVQYRFGKREFPHAHTTAEAPDLQRMFSAVKSGGGEAVVMEVSSHGLSLKRVLGTRFRAGIMTNLTRDHLDFHRTMRKYFNAKAMLFEGLPAAVEGGVAAVNRDSAAGRAMARRTSARVVWFGMQRGKGTEVRAREVVTSVRGTGFILEAGNRRAPVRLRMFGAHNVSNALAAAAAAHGCGIGMAEIKRGLEQLLRVPGRLERVPLAAPFSAVVDYAHTPDALDRALVSVRSVARRRVIVVFGCGGNRDRGKRPVMGRIASERANFSWITSDNPRNEAPMAIIREITGGIRRRGRYSVEPDRRRAIASALGQARAGDVVLVAGKGHENCQTIMGRSIPFDDSRVVRREWARLR